MTLGEKIKALRKERKMTLVQVAGEHLTKGMLSLIENGKAQPSMDSLQHIAQQLQIDVAELLANDNNKEIRATLTRGEQLYTAFRRAVFDEQQMQEIGQQLLTLIEPFADNNLLKGQNFEEVRLRELYFIARYHLKLDQTAAPFLSLVDLYKKVHAYSHVLQSYTRLSSVLIEQRQYDEAIDYLQEAEKFMQLYDFSIDDVVKLNLYYTFAITYAAMNSSEEMEKYLNLALRITEEKGIFYRLNDFYRFLFFIHCSKGDAEKSQHYLQKLYYMSKLTEDPFDEVFYDLLTLQYMNQIEQDFEKVLHTKVEHDILMQEAMKPILFLLHGEYAYAHWKVGQYEEALTLLQPIYVHNRNQHPIDLAILYRAFAIRALCYKALGDNENAKRDILYAMDGVKDFPPSFDQQFIEQAHRTIII